MADSDSNLIDYFEFTPCCQGQDTLYFLGDSTDLTWPAVYLYQGKCYTVNFLFNEPNPGNLELIPLDELTFEDSCLESDCECCQCIRVRSKNVIPAPIAIPIINCNGEIEGLSIPIDRAWSEKICARSWDVDLKNFEVEVFGDCDSDGGPTINCSTHQVTISTDSPAGSIRYTNCETGLIETIVYDFAAQPLVFTFCALDSEPVFTTGDDEIIGDCSIITANFTCPIETCFLLTDCEGVEEEVYASYASIEPYLDTDINIITIDGFPGTCWSFREISECECAIDVTVLTTWVDCETCRKCKGYKLTNCEDATYVKYTTNDLSDHIGKAVEFENCPGCWYVECLEIAPPSDQNLIVEYSFDDCKDCLSKFWKLTPCVGEHDPIFTDTDLTLYFGLIVTLDNIPGVCWTLEEVRDLEENTFETVFINTYYTECDECAVDILDCQCSSAVNSWPIATPIQYLDCNGVWQTTAPILPGQRTEKLCVVQWSVIGKIASEIEWYGDCNEVESNDTTEPNTWECPIVTPRLRSVKPGYDTPGCPADYFEKISCKFAEALYKDVLADRYGITTNCSSAEFDKWDIKKELLNLAAITNPDFDCPPITSGCYDVCATMGAFENCLTGSCHSYSITYEPNTPDTITYTDCTTCEITTIEHGDLDTPIVYNICIKPGTPVVTEGFLEHTGDCEPGPAPVPACLQYSILLSPPLPAGSYSYTDCTGADQIVNYPNILIGELTLVCMEEGSFSGDPAITVTEIGPCP